MNDKKSDARRRAGMKTPTPGPPASGRWATALTRVAPNEVEIRGFPLDELMGRLSFVEAVYLLLCGELPSPAIGKLFGAVLVSSIDHGV